MAYPWSQVIASAHTAIREEAAVHRYVVKLRLTRASGSRSGGGMAGPLRRRALARVAADRGIGDRARQRRDQARGARYEICQPKLRPATWTVTEVDPGKAFTWKTRNLMGWTIGGHILSTEDDGTTGVILRISFVGPLSPLIALLTGSLTQSYLDQEAAALVATVKGRR